MASQKRAAFYPVQQESSFVIPPGTSKAVAIKSPPIARKHPSESEAKVTNPPSQTTAESLALEVSSSVFTNDKQVMAPPIVPTMPLAHRQHITGNNTSFRSGSRPGELRSQVPINTQFAPTGVQYIRPVSNPQMSTVPPPYSSLNPQRVQSQPSTVRQPNLMASSQLSDPSLPFQPPPAFSLPLDVHAQTYIPLWLKAISDSPAEVMTCLPLPSIDYMTYSKEFAGAGTLPQLDPVDLPPICSTLMKHASSTQLNRVDYHEFFMQNIQNEIASQADYLLKLDMFNTPYESARFGPSCYRVKIIGLRDLSPQVELGDIILIRQILPNFYAFEAAQTWYAPGGGREKGLFAPGFSGKEFHAVVYGLSRTKEEVLLRIDGLESSTAGTCNLRFIVQEHRVSPLCRSVTSTANQFRAWSADQNRPDWIDPMLFPEQTHSVMQTQLSRGTFDLDWFDTELNYEQKKAIDAIVSNNYGPVPFLVSGPPGTGKTKTLVETVLQLLNNPPQNVTPHLLVCAPSDPAADTITRRLKRHLRHSELFRLNNWTRSPAEVPDDILPFCFMQEATSSVGNLFAIPNFTTMMKYKVVVTRCIDADMLVQARLTNRDLTELALGLLFKISPRSVERISPTLHWTALLIDEAAQATEPEALIPLSVVNTTSTNMNTSNDMEPFRPQFVMVGDEHQLGPYLFLKSGFLSVSLFERLFKRPFYADHPLSRAHGLKPLIAKLLPLPRPAFVHLIRNYRSHPAILATSSILFYADTLIAEANTRSIVTEEFSLWKAPYRWPLIFHQISSTDHQEDIISTNSTGAGLYNPGEAVTALRLVEDLLIAGGHHPGRRDTAGSETLHPADIAVISPFRSQVKYLRDLFRSHNLANVNIGPVEAFQGLESRIVIFCTTRTRLGNPSDSMGGISRFVREDARSNLGVIDQKKKFNVAMTRAKEALIVIGDERALTCTNDECWTHFLKFVGRNGAVIFDDNNAGEARFHQQMEHWNDHVGRFEAALRFGVEIGDAQGRTMLGRDEFDDDDDDDRGHTVSETTSSSLQLRGMTRSSDDRMLSDGMAAGYSL